MLHSTEDFVEFEVTTNDMNFAKQIRAKRDARYGNIYSEKASDLRWVGDLGEIKVNQALMMCNLEQTDWLYESDAAGKCDFVFFGKDIDVKTVKRNVPMRLDYTAQITAKHANTPLDYIIFTCYEVNANKVVVLGAISKSEFLKQARYYGEGEKVHANYTIRKGHEIYNIDVRKLTPFRYFIREVRASSNLAAIA